MDNRKPIFNDGHSEPVCEPCFWLLQFPGGNCKCALGMEWPSETDTPDDCFQFVSNWDKKEKSKAKEGMNGNIL